MKVSPEFLADLKLLAIDYKWTDEMKAHVKDSVKAYPTEFIQYLSSLASAHRHGYSDVGGRGLAVFCAEHGIAHPYVGELEETVDA